MAVYLSPRASEGEVRWGIIGCGDVTEKKSGPALQLARRSKLVAVMRRDAAKAADYAKRHGVPRWYATVEELLADGEVNAVYLATPPGSHVDLALKVAEAGLPLYCEKPAARTAWECAAMAAAFATRRLPLYIAYYRRAYPRYEFLRRCVAEGRLGSVTRVEYDFRKKGAPRPGEAEIWRLDAKTSGGGLFVDVGSHALDLIEFVLGAELVVKDAKAQGRPGEVEQAVHVDFAFGSATTSWASWDFAASDDRDELVIYGSDVVARCPDCMNGAAVILESPDGSEAVETFDPPAPVQLPLVQKVVDALLDGTECPATPEASTRTSAVIDEALDCYYKGRGPDGVPFWDRPETWNVPP